MLQLDEPTPGYKAPKFSNASIKVTSEDAHLGRVGVAGSEGSVHRG